MRLRPLIIASALFLSHTVALGAPRIVTLPVSVPTAGVVMGDGSGRWTLDVYNTSATEICCWPSDEQSFADCVGIPASENRPFGVCQNGQCTGQTTITCHSTSGSVTVDIVEQGFVPVRTHTPTDTPTDTPTATPTDTPA